jgi:SAM-dependent methyltransferase
MINVSTYYKHVSMTTSHKQPSTIDWLLADMRQYFNDKQPSLLALFDIYAEEAAFGRRYIASDLGSLPLGAKILEVGAGSLLLSCQLIREGFQVTALEPIGIGFSHFEQMRQIVLARAATLECLPKTLNINAEALTESDLFDYVFSINVMEHVEDISLVIARIAKSLKPGASYRFTCPNYLFPYDPHFNIPTLISKRFTEKILGGKIFGSKKVFDSAGTWKSLNWINVVQIRKIVQLLPGLKVTFNRCLFVATIERIASDAHFASRRSSIIRIIFLLLLKSQLYRLLRFIPAALQPIIDCKLQKKKKGRSPRCFGSRGKQ